LNSNLRIHYFKIKIKIKMAKTPKTPKTLKKPAPPMGCRSLAALRERRRNERLLQAAEAAEQRGIQQAELERRDTERRRREHEASLRHAAFARIQEEIEIGLIRQEAAAQVAEEEAQAVRRYNTNRQTYILARVFYHGTVAPVYPSDSDDLGPYDED
jgi:hypothetical protein